MQTWWHKKGSKSHASASNIAEKMLHALKRRMSINGVLTSVDRATLDDGTRIEVSWAGSIPSVHITPVGSLDKKQCGLYIESGMLDLGVATSGDRWNAEASVFDDSPATLYFGDNADCVGFGGVNGGAILHIIGANVSRVDTQCLGQTGDSAVVSKLTSAAKKKTQYLHPASKYNGLLRRYVSAVYGASYLAYSNVANTLYIEGRKIGDYSMEGPAAPLSAYGVAGITILENAVFFILGNRQFTDAVGNPQVSLLAVYPLFKTECHKYAYEAWQVLAKGTIDTIEGKKLLALAMSGMYPSNNIAGSVGLISATELAFNRYGTKIASTIENEDTETNGYVVVTVLKNLDGSVGNTVAYTWNTLPKVVSDTADEAKKTLRVFYEFDTDYFVELYEYTKDENIADEIPYAQCNRSSLTGFFVSWEVTPHWEQFIAPTLPNAAQVNMYPDMLTCADTLKARDRTYGVVKKVNGAIIWSSVELLANRVSGGNLMSTFLGSPVVTSAIDPVNFGKTLLGSPSDYDNTDYTTLAITKKTSYPAFSYGAVMYGDYGCPTETTGGTYSFSGGISGAGADAACKAVNPASSIFDAYPTAPESTYQLTTYQSFAHAGDRQYNTRDVRVYRVAGCHDAIALSIGERVRQFNGVYELGQSIYKIYYKYERKDTEADCAVGAAHFFIPHTADDGVLINVTPDHGYSEFMLVSPTAYIPYPSNPGGPTYNNNTTSHRQIQRSYFGVAVLREVLINADNTVDVRVKNGSVKQRNQPGGIFGYPYYDSNSAYDPSSIDLTASACYRNLHVFDAIPTVLSDIIVETSIGDHTIDFIFAALYTNYKWYNVESQLGGFSRVDITLGEGGSINSDRQTFTGGYPAVSNPSFIGWA